MEMRQKNFTDPYPKLPKLERTVIKLRSFELTLVLFYTEEIRRTVVDMIQTTDRWRVRVDKNYIERAPKYEKNVWEKSLSALVADGAISKVKKCEIVNLVDFRNDIGHRIDHLFSDLEMTGFLGDHMSKRFRDRFDIKDFKHGVADQMRQVLDELREVVAEFRTSS